MIPHLNNKVVTVVLLSDGTKLKTSVSKERTLTIVLPSKTIDPIASVIKVTVTGRVNAKTVLETKK